MRFVLDTNSLGAGDKPCEFIFCAFELQPHTHSYCSYHQLLSGTCVYLCNVIVYSEVSTRRLQFVTSLLATNYVLQVYILKGH